jgi:hypothetical protein
LPIRSQADNDLRLHIVLAVRRRETAIDFQTAAASQLDGLDDVSVLRKAAADQRILVTHDKRSMPAALRTLIEEG